MIFNMVGGTGGSGGSGEGYAAISVAYPTGSICTCTQGADTLTASDTSGVYIFLVPRAGDWIVSCTDGAKTASKTVVISDQGQVEVIALVYEYYIYKAGDECADVTGGWTSEGYVRMSSGGTSTPCSAAEKKSDRIHIVSGSSTVRMLGTNEPINLDNYSVLEIDWQGLTKLASTSYPGTINLFITKKKNPYGSPIALEYGNPGARKVSVVDLSNYTGEYYIVVDTGYAISGVSGDVFSIQLIP